MKILISDPLHNEGINVLKDANFEIIDASKKSKEQKVELARSADAWIVRSGTVIDKSSLDNTLNLKIIGRAGVGVDNIDISYATTKGIVVVNTPDVNTISACEHTIGLMLSLSRNIPLGDNAIKSGDWNRHQLIGSELRSKTLGIIGLGKIGKELMERCKAFGMKIIAYDPYLKKEIFNNGLVSIVGLDELLINSDYISVHIPLNDGTRNLINEKSFDLMKTTARIINVARGGIINEKDLSKALIENKIAGAALDVFSIEPIEKNNPLLNAPNIILTPHLGASTEEAKKGVSISVCNQIVEYLLNEKIANALNFPISDKEIFKKIEYYLVLAEKMGYLQAQINDEAIHSVKIECFGSIKESQAIMLAFLKGLLKERTPERVNYINVESLSKEFDIIIEHSFNSASISYDNLIKTSIKTRKNKTKISGSVFEGNRLRLVKIFGYEMDVNPNGNMLFINNNDVPGVIGMVGTVLGKSKINIREFLLSKKESEPNAFSVVKLDSLASKEVLEKINSFNEIKSIIQLSC